MVTYDLIVVGGGPAGATCAREAAQNGLSVLIIEKSFHPRRKACGGGITTKVLDALDIDTSGIIERDQYGFRLYSPSGMIVENRKNEPVGATVRREDFDHLLLLKAEAAGANLIQGESVVDVIEDTSTVSAVTSAGMYNGRILVGADGVNSIVGRKTGLLTRLSPEDSGLCIEASVPMDSSDIQRIFSMNDDSQKSIIEMFFGQVIHGYSWAFPKKNEISLGIGGRLSKISDLKGSWNHFVSTFKRQHGVKCDISNATSARLPLRGKVSNTCSKRIMLVGDAAGLVAPVTGEGIYYAIESGQTAALVAKNVIGRGQAANCFDYQQLCETMFNEDLSAANFLGKFLLGSSDRMERVCKMVRNDEVLRDFMMELLMGMRPYKDLRNDFVKRVMTKHPLQALRMALK